MHDDEKSRAVLQPPTFVFTGLDEAGSLSAEVPVFTMAVVVTPQPQLVRHVIPRAVLRSGKRLDRPAKDASEIKWNNASQRIRTLVLRALADADVELYALVVRKGGRKIEDNPENYGILVSELMSLCWHVYPNMALALDRHFTSPAQIAAVNTLIYRGWPVQGVLSLSHVNSQASPLVQLADLAAGSVYAWHHHGDATMQIISHKFGATLVEEWRHIKARWLDGGQQKTELPG